MEHITKGKHLMGSEMGFRRNCVKKELITPALPYLIMYPSKSTSQDPLQSSPSELQVSVCLKFMHIDELLPLI